MTTVLNDVAAQPARVRRREIRVALLGLGQVGTAVAATAAALADSRFSITAAVVRDVSRPRAVDTSRFTLTTDPWEALASNPDVVVEVLGGLEPARSAILAALAARIVTANKSLLAAHGDELFAAAARAGVPLLYEASVLAGVPFLGMFRRRPLARTVTGFLPCVESA
jgi:homoserine dehydrogenase